MPESLLAPNRSLEELEELSPEELLRWAHAAHGDRAGIITSFQDTGSVIVDLAQRVAPGLRVLTVDTLRLHPETYALMESMEKRYGIVIERFEPERKRLERMVSDHGEYLFFDTKAKQELCCQVRKVEPNQRALATLDVWFTGLRRDQSAFRQATPKVSRVKQPEGHQIIKIAPLADWDEEQVGAYLRERGVPRNALYDQGYTSIGCMICTTPTQPGEDKRAGRWRWFNEHHAGEKKECGIHTGGSGI
jgi:phosphoadenylyl-sulfate reductase (thioredoxin)